MKLKDLKKSVDHLLKYEDPDSEIFIPNNGGGMGGTSGTRVKNITSGIDWDRGRLFIHPEIKMKEIPNSEYNFIEPDYYKQKDGLQTIDRMIMLWGKEKTALWCEMTAFKYKERIGRKPGEDIYKEQSKLNWYLNKCLELRNDTNT